MNQEYRSPRTLSLLAIGGLAVVGLCELAAAVVGVAQVAMPNTTFALDEVTEFSTWLMIQSLIALVQTPVFLATVVVFLMWLYRTHSNLSLLRPMNLQFTPGWAVGWWFIPFANLVKPFQVMREVWWESDPVVDDEPTFLSASLHSAPTYMGFWWGLWIVANILSNVTARLFDPEDIASVTISGYMFTITGITFAAAAALAIIVVKDTTARQESRALAVAQLSRTEPPPPPTFANE